MRIDQEPGELEALLESFKEDLEAGAELVKMEEGARTPLQNLPTFEELLGYEEDMKRAIEEYFGVNLAALNVVEEYEMDGTPGERKIKVRVIVTNDPEVFLGEYTDESGDVDWCIRSRHVQE